MKTVVLLGGPFTMQKIELTAQPEHIEIRGQIYARIDDPHTGQSLDGYALAQRPHTVA